MDKINKYQCTMKLFDSSINPEKDTPMEATFFAKTIAEIPHVTRIGSIIRLHRAQTKKFKKTYQINCDVGIKSAWVLFDPSIGSAAADESGKLHTFDAEEKAILADTRKVAKAYFTKNELKAMTFKEAEKKKPKDFDTICYVKEVKKKGTTNKVVLTDGEKTVKLDVESTSRLAIVPEEVIRIRSANFTDKKCDTIELNEYSNVLRVSDDYKSAKEIMKKIKD